MRLLERLCQASRATARRVPPKALVALALIAPATAHPSPEPVTVSATRIEARGFDTPAAVDVFEIDPDTSQRPGVNLSEALVAAPGLAIRNRQNYAQDLQLSSRGFGARAAFGVRGVRLLQDGIVLGTPDGQGQTGLFDLDSAERIEVLRGPFAALYGNSAGGVVSVFSAPPAAEPRLRAFGAAGSFGTWKAGVGFGTGLVGGLAAEGQRSEFESDGWREHSRVRRSLSSGQFAWQSGENDRLTLRLIALDQPDTLDPLGLTRDQVAADPRQAGSGARAFDTRKSVDHRQAGLSWQRRLDERQTLTVAGFVGEREVSQYLAFAGAAPTSSGGVVSLDRGFGGLSARWERRDQLAGGPLELGAGLEYERSSERRRGYVNDFGVQGELRRDERGVVSGLGAWTVAQWWFAERWRLAAGVRHARIGFEVRDDFVTALNPDDSGSRTDQANLPVIGLLHALDEQVHLYLSAGRGFETPTLAELAYRPDGQPGLNLELEPSTSSTVELGIKARLNAGLRSSLAIFRTDTRNDIVPDLNIGGRTTFRNAARTRRQGLEAGLEALLARGWQARLSWTWLDARFSEYAASDGSDLAGKRLPGVARSVAQAELAWRDAASGFVTVLETQWSSSVPVDDANTARADAWLLVNWSAGFDWRAAGWRVAPYLRIDNLFDRDYIGSVISNAAGGRYYEPAAGRAGLAGLRVSRTL